MRDESSFHITTGLFLDAVYDLFEAAWRRNEKPALRGYLDYLAGPMREAALPELLRLDVHYRLCAGEQPSAPDYHEQLPEFAGFVNAYFTNMPTGSFPVLVDSDAATTPHDTVACRALATPKVPPAVIPGYQIRGELGRGGMGVVYQARQTKPNRLVALKMILAGSHAGAAELTRFQIETEALARLQHPHFVQVYEVCEHDGTVFFSMEYCGGGSLAKKLNGTPLPAREAAALVRTLAQSMQAAHDKGIIHRDLKPANILLTDEGVLKIADFGLAKNIDASGPTQTGAILGTPSYMAPEQAEGRSKDSGRAVDIYALGAILYELLTGRPPFKAATIPDTLIQVVRDDPVPPRLLQSTVPRHLEAICLMCLRKDPAKRYCTAMALADDLHRFLNHEPIEAKEDSLGGRLREAIESYRDIPTLDTWPAIFWAAAILFMTHTAVFFLAWFDHPVYQVWLVWGLYVAVSLALVWHYHLSRYRAITFVERQSMTITLATTVMWAALVIILGPLNPLASARESLICYPALVILAGMGTFIHGMIHWGRFYVVGLAHIPFAFTLRFIPDLAPLLYGTLSALVLCWAGVRVLGLLTPKVSR